jgi:choline dehydrogenase-like flavoprotein
MNKDNEYDAIIIGSGTCGATIARELSKQKKKVLILERGGNKPLSESFFNILSISDTVSLGDKLMIMRALTTGGSTALYFGVADLPPLDVFNKLGINLTRELAEIRKELPIKELPDDLISPQALKLRDGASKLGYEWKKKLMFIDQSKSTNGYSYDAKWKARSYVQEAIDYGATLINRATVSKVLVDNNQAVGVEYRLSSKKTFRVYGSKIILAAGSAASPIILMDSGIRNIKDHGFFIDPSFALFGTVKGLNGADSYLGSMSMDYEDDVVVGDLNTTKGFYRMLMLANAKPQRLFSHASTVGIGVKVKDSLGGEIREKNRFYKQLTEDDRNKLKRGGEKALKILQSAGATNIFQTAYGATDLGGTLKIGKHVDKNLQTEFENLYVCDGSVIPEDVRLSPTLTLLCLGKHLAKNLFASSVAAKGSARNLEIVHES